jgi:hypothetical protein
MRLRAAFVASLFVAVAGAVPSVASADVVGPSSAPKSAFVEQTFVATTPVQVIAAQAGLAYRVWSVAIQNEGATTAHVDFGYAPSNNNCTTGQTGQTPSWRLAATSAPVDFLSGGGYPLFTTALENRALCVKFSTAVAGSAHVVYTEVDLDAATYNTSQPVTVSNTPAFSVSGTPNVKVVNTSSEDVPVDCQTGCSGGGGGSVTLSAIDGTAQTWFDQWRQAMYVGLALIVFCIVGLLVRTFPKKRLPL